VNQMRLSRWLKNHLLNSVLLHTTTHQLSQSQQVKSLKLSR
jgi:hypothetical protein